MASILRIFEKLFDSIRTWARLIGRPLASLTTPSRTDVPANTLNVTRRKGTKLFFFQAEDGIRDVAVTGVQTCALPISRAPHAHGRRESPGAARRRRRWRLPGRRASRRPAARERAGMRETPRRAGLRPSAELGDPQPIARPDVVLALEAVPAGHVGDRQPVQLCERAPPLPRPGARGLVRGPPPAGGPG